MKKFGLILSMLLLIVVSADSTFAQCAMCKGAVETNMSTGKNVIGNGINVGIAYLFVFPYLTVGIIAYLWYRNSRKALAQKMALQARMREVLK